MKLSQYQTASTRTMPKKGQQAFINYAFGLTGETGEVVDLLKKTLFHGHKLDQGKLEEELGDVLHYLSGIATLADICLERVAERNIAKLRARYPEGFEKVRSINRSEYADFTKEYHEYVCKMVSAFEAGDPVKVLGYNDWKDSVYKYEPEKIEYESPEERLFDER